VQKTLEFSKFFAVSARTRGEWCWDSTDIFGEGEKGVNFSQICADILYGRSLNLNSDLLK